MRLCRFGPPAEEKPGLLLPGGERVDARGFFDGFPLARDWDEAFFAAGGLLPLATWATSEAQRAPRVSKAERWAPAVARPSKIVCIGLNYVDHAKETGAQLPKEPVFFMKATTAWAGVNDDVLLPPGAEKLDWEVELAFVIGRKARYVSEEDALAHIAGYGVMNDYSERAFQKERGGQWTKGKSCDSFAPFGPCLVTPDEAPDPRRAHLWLEVNGARKQDSSTAQMIFDVAMLLSYVTQFMTLLPGDVISTGTPAGVGMGHVPATYLRAGDRIAWGIEGLGRGDQTVVVG
jgi:2-keto-4-pentenoate hydratase/2-oxohepta-3-ene-1,7-dioic acid hydratase in catechol pathway